MLDGCTDYVGAAVTCVTDGPSQLLAIDGPDCAQAAADIATVAGRARTGAVKLSCVVGRFLTVESPCLSSEKVGYVEVYFSSAVKDNCTSLTCMRP